MTIQRKSSDLLNSIPIKDGSSNEKATAKVAVSSSHEKEKFIQDKSKDLIVRPTDKGSNMVAENLKTKKNVSLTPPKNRSFSSKQPGTIEGELYINDNALPDALQKEQKLRFSKGLPFVFAIHTPKQGKTQFFNSHDLLNDQEDFSLPEDAKIFCTHKHLDQPFQIMTVERWRNGPDSCIHFLLTDFEDGGDEDEDKEDLIDMSSAKLIISAMFHLGVEVPKNINAALDAVRDDPYKDEPRASNKALIYSIRANSLPLVDHLLRKGAVYNYMDDFGNEALLEASEPGKEAILQRLIANAKFQNIYS